MSEYTFTIAPKLAKAQFFTTTALYRCLWGGRGSGKTRTIAEACLLWGMYFHSIGLHGQIVCAREFLNSLEDSSLAELKAVIEEKSELAAFWDVGANYIRSKDRKIYFTFIGLNQNLNSIKSRARILLVWVDEAETVSELAWMKLIPTVRYYDEQWTAEIWVSFNPESPESATYKRFVAEAADDPDFISIKMNYTDNPWFGGKMEKDRLRDLKNNPTDYAWIWEGEFRTISDAQVFAGKFDTEEFEPGRLWDGPYFGLDFGFAQDPTAAVECWVYDRNLYIRREAGRVGLELDDYAAFFKDRMPAMERHAVRADSARPENISYLSRHGIPQIKSVRKWAGSVEDGVAFIKAFNRVIVHPECSEVLREFRLYSYKVDRLSGDIMPKIVDANNHYIDAIRYAIEPLIGGSSEQVFGVL